MKKINQGHQHQHDRRVGDGAQQITQVMAPLQNFGIPQSPQPQSNQLDSSFNSIPRQQQIILSPNFARPFPTQNSIPNNKNHVQLSQVPIQPPKAILPHFTPDIRQESQSSTPTQNLGLALFNKNLQSDRTSELREEETIFDALDAQLQEETVVRLQEQKHLENIAVNQLQHDIEANRQEEAVRFQEERALQEKAFQEHLSKNSFLIQQQRKLEERVNNERLRMIEEERLMELQEVRRQKEIFRLENKRNELKEQLEERKRFSAHKAIASTFRGDNPLRLNAFQNAVIASSASETGRFHTRPQPV